MLGVHVTLNRPARAVADKLPSGRTFMTIYAGGAAISLPGFDDETLAAARILRDSLTESIQFIETTLAALQPPVRSHHMEENVQEEKPAAPVEEQKPAEGTTEAPPADGAKDDTTSDQQ